MPGGIEDYALIGDCETAALVSRDGSIDWLCWPRFDSRLFAALLGSPENGRWRIAPTSDRPETADGTGRDTLILETRVRAAKGLRHSSTSCLRATACQTRPELSKARPARRLRFRLVDPVRLRAHRSLGEPARRVHAVGDRRTEHPDAPDARGAAWGRHAHQRPSSRSRQASGGLRADLFALPPRLRPSSDPLESLARYGGFLDRILLAVPRRGNWTEDVRRSLITLKALTYRPTGGIVAAPTTSLPERIGGERNWDYRYCWLRDATLTLMAFMHLGYYEEARAWREWLLRAIAGDPAQMQIMYGVAGERHLLEWDVPWLAGFRPPGPYGSAMRRRAVAARCLRRSR